MLRASFCKMNLLLWLSLSLLASPLPSALAQERKIQQWNEFQPRSERSSSWDKQLIALEQAQRFLTFKKDVVVAVIDTGIDLSHPDLKSHLWKNSGESGIDSLGRDKSSNGVDDDRNGFIDDLHGWNFVTGSSQVQDTHGHGSHVAGIIAQISPGARIMVLKYFDSTSNGDDHIRHTIAAIHYARQNGAHIINYSAGGLSENSLEKTAIAQAGRAGIVFVAAAGNEASNSDIVGYYPANYPLENIVSVTALTPQKNLVSSSNYSATLVDIAAPGESIYSTLPGGQYGQLTGTSQATAFVSGVVALMRASRSDLTRPQDMIQILIKSGAWNGNLQDKVQQASQLNALRALTMKGEKSGVVRSRRNAQDALAKWLPARPPAEGPILNRAPSGL